MRTPSEAIALSYSKVSVKGLSNLSNPDDVKQFGNSPSYSCTV